MGTTTTLPAAPAAQPTPYDPALAAYEEMAVVYDAFTRAYDYERFLSVIEQLALQHGLAGRDVLDVACGTGKSFMPLLRRGYRVTACDLSPEMVRLAQSKSAGRANVVVADMRALPQLGQFDLVTCLDDSINYLLTDDEVAAALGGIARLLRPGGLLLFDLNSLRTYRSVFSQTFASDEEGVFFCWRGDTSPELDAGGQAAATLEAFLPRAGGSWSRRCMRHVQRHHPRTTMSLLSAAAGLDVIKVWGQRPGVQLDPIPSEHEHTKLLYLARRSTPTAP
jgi:SAM-dependent methyltransferase